MSELVPCPECHRHVRKTELSCPFCGTSVSLAQLPAPVLPGRRLGRAATFAFSATIVGAAALVACDDEGGVVPIYGGPPSVGAAGSPAEGGAGAQAGAAAHGGADAQPVGGMPGTSGAPSSAGAGGEDQEVGGAGPVNAGGEGGVGGSFAVYGGPPAGAGGA